MKAVIISDAADCNVDKFMACRFKEKYKVLLLEGNATDEELRETFEYIYAQYVDYSGLYLTKEFEMSAYIHYLDVRIETIDRFILLQRKFIEEFNAPFVPAFGLLKKYGHHLVWNHKYPDADLFLRKLEKIELKEDKFRTIRNTKIDELMELRKKHVNKEHTPLESRKEFIIMLNRLGQAKFHIDKQQTSVEELALMIKDHRDQVETEKMNAKKTR